MKRMKLTRAELSAAQMAMSVMWFELQDDTESKTLQSALMKFRTALSTWDGEGVATLIWTPGGGLDQPSLQTIPRTPQTWAGGIWIKPQRTHNSGHHGLPCRETSHS